MGTAERADTAFIGRRKGGQAVSVANWLVSSSAGNHRILSAQLEPNLTTRMLSERHALTSGVEDDQYNGFISCYSPMECVDCFRNCLSCAEMLLLSVFSSLNGEFSCDDVSSARNGMAVPFEFRVWLKNDFQYG